MGESKNDNRRHQQMPMPQTTHRPDYNQKMPYWQRAHRDWRFWLGVVCISTALYVYVMSNDLSMLPRR